MLEENKEIYRQVADAIIPNWNEMDKNDLIRCAAYCEDKRKQEGYISAIMLKYWNKLDSYYYKCKLVATPEDVHMWLTIAVMYAINRKPWENSKFTIYHDDKGPDKVVNRIIESKRLTFYQQLNRYKRVINSGIISLDGLTDDYKDVFSPTYNDDYSFELYDLVIGSFQKQDYLLSFIIDALMYEDVNDNDTSYRKMISHLKKLDDKFIKIFSERYFIDAEKVKQALPYVTNLSPLILRKKLHYNIIRLKELLKEGYN